ncbi:MAG: alpha/beta fold hydrolase [Aliidongia sp.]
MAFPAARFIESNGLRMAVHEQGSGTPVVLCHGFPELAFAWRHQLPALAAAGFHAIAPDQRGYGDTGGPKGPDFGAALRHGASDRRPGRAARRARPRKGGVLRP